MRKVILFVSVVLLAPAVFAQSPQSSPANPDNVTANVINNCKVDTFDLTFGDYDPVVANDTAPLDATAVVNVYCTKGAKFLTLELDNGLYYDGVSGNRQMDLAGVLVEKLQYQIYRTTVAGGVWNTTNTVAAVANSTGKNNPIDGGYTAYGRVFAGQDVSAGLYEDTVIATVNF
jgi:spore coat protein U-like protein